MFVWHIILPFSVPWLAKYGEDLLCKVADVIEEVGLM